MQRNHTSFPSSGDNFETLTSLSFESVSIDGLEAISFLHDCEVALAYFKAHKDTVPVQPSDSTSKPVT